MNKDYLKEFLSIYWLRPETAILNGLLAKNLPPKYLDDYEKSVDINCGDGIFSFIANGGEIDSSFNLYSNTKISSSIIQKEDIYNYYDDTYNPKVLNYANNKYTYGIDVNDKMLLKSEKLRIYNSPLLYTGNKDLNSRGYPLQSLETQRAISLEGNMDLVTIFSSTYMYKNVPLLLEKMKSLLKENGTLIINIKTDAFLSFYKSIEKNYPKKFAQYIERDMLNSFPSLHSEIYWEEILKKADFEIESKTPTFSDKLVPLWGVGLRFLTPILVKMSNAIVDYEQFSEIKRDFVETFHEILLDFYEEDFGKNASSYLYILKKR